MPQELTKNELERQLSDRSESIKRRIDGLEDEIVTTPQAIKSAITEHPLVGIGMTVLAGLAVGLLFARRKSKRSRRTKAAHQDLVEKYVDAVGVEVDRAVKKGKDAGSSVRKILERNAPVIIYREASESDERPGFFRQAGSTIMHAALTLVIHSATGFIASMLQSRAEELHALDSDGRPPHEGPLS